MSERKITIEVTPEELDLLAEALDSHAYWQLSEDHERNNGYTNSASVEVTTCQMLENRLRGIYAKHVPPERVEEAKR